MSTPPTIVLPVKDCFLALPRNFFAGGGAHGSLLVVGFDEVTTADDVEGETERGRADSEGSESECRLLRFIVRALKGLRENLSSKSILLTLSKSPRASSKATSRSTIGSTVSSSSLL